MGAITKHYNSALNITVDDLEVVGKDTLIGGFGGLVVAGISALNKGSLDFKVGSQKVPLDFLGSVAVGLLSETTRTPELGLIGVGMAGAAGARLLTPILAKTFGAHGEDDEAASMGWGLDAGEDPLVASAKYL